MLNMFWIDDLKARTLWKTEIKVDSSLIGDLKEQILSMAESILDVSWLWIDEMTEWEWKISE